jgi:hypothetical protein
MLGCGNDKPIPKRVESNALTDADQNPGSSHPGLGQDPPAPAKQQEILNSTMSGLVSTTIDDRLV